MTCIVGIETKDGVLIGGDSAGVSGWSLTIRADQKVFTTGAYVMGFTTSFRMGQLLRYSLDVGAPTGDIDAFMATTFIDAVRKTLKAGGYAKADNSVETGGTFLVGVHGRLYSIHDDYQVGRPACGYDAVGCGGDIAVGSLYSSSHMTSASDRLRLALAAAEHFSAGVAGPFYICTEPTAA